MKRSLLLPIAAIVSIAILMGGCGGMETKPAGSKYPEKAITMIVPFSVGGGLDLTARELEKLATKQLGQPLIIVNRPGGAGTIGWNELTSANPDGYTLGIVSGEILLHPLYSDSKYNYPTAIEPIVQISSLAPILVIHSKQPWKTIGELTSYAESHPGQVKFAHSGIGSIQHIIGETFAKEAKINIKQVPFRGASEMSAALLGEHVQVAILGPATVKEHLRNGTLRALAIAGEKRFVDPVLKDVPTFREAGLDVAFSYWIGIGSPKGLSPVVKDRLSSAFKAIVNDPVFRLNNERLGLQLEYLDSQSTAIKWAEEHQKYAKVVKETGIAELIKSQKK